MTASFFDDSAASSPPLDGGPAYPLPLMAERESDTVVNYDCLTGMSLRDHFATHAMAAILARPAPTGSDALAAALAQARREALEEAAALHDEAAEHDAHGLEYSSLVGIPISNAEEVRASVKWHECYAAAIRALLPAPSTKRVS